MRLVNTLSDSKKATPKLVMLGAGGHARVLQEVLSEVGFELHGFVAPRDTESKLGLKADGDEVAWLGADDNLLEFAPADHLLVNGLGSAGSLAVRTSVYAKFRKAGFKFLQVEASTAMVSRTASLHEGVQVLHGAIVHVDALINENTIINTGAIIEHGVVVGANCHVSVGSVICGDVAIGNSTHIGAGATVIQGIEIGENCIIGAGAVVISDVPDNHMAIGVPAQNRPIGVK